MTAISRPSGTGYAQTRGNYGSGNQLPKEIVKGAFPDAKGTETRDSDKKTPRSDRKDLPGERRLEDSDFLPGLQGDTRSPLPDAKGTESRDSGKDSPRSGEVKIDGSRGAGTPIGALGPSGDFYDLAGNAPSLGASHLPADEQRSATVETKVESTRIIRPPNKGLA